MASKTVELYCCCCCCCCCYYYYYYYYYNDQASLSTYYVSSTVVCGMATSSLSWGCCERNTNFIIIVYAGVLEHKDIK